MIALLRAHGYEDVGALTIGEIWQEAGITMARVRSEQAAQAQLILQALWATPNMCVDADGTKKMMKQFDATIERLTGA